MAHRFDQEFMCTIDDVVQGYRLREHVLGFSQ
jgi:hypothetical protein